MDWDTYMETLTKRQAALEETQSVCRAWAEGIRSDEIRKSEIARLLEFTEFNPHQAHRFVEVVLSEQVQFNRAVIAMLTDLDHRKGE